MKNGHRPDSRYLQPLAEGRFLEIAEGNDEAEFGRGVCLAINDEIAAMAKAGAGGALYWREDGPRFTESGGLRGVEDYAARRPRIRTAEPANQDG